MSFVLTFLKEGKDIQIILLYKIMTLRNCTYLINKSKISLFYQSPGAAYKRVYLTTQMLGCGL